MSRTRPVEVPEARSARSGAQVKLIEGTYSIPNSSSQRSIVGRAGGAGAAHRATAAGAGWRRRKLERTGR